MIKKISIFASGNGLNTFNLIKYFKNNKNVEVSCVITNNPNSGVILISKDKIIIDGFHRWRLSQDSKAIKEVYNGKIPCAILDIDRPSAMILTIRMNRAKGSHVAVQMSEIIHELIDVHKLDHKQIAEEIGATKDEIDLLYQDGVFKMKNIKDYKYSKAWIPQDTRIEAKP